MDKIAVVTGAAGGLGRAISAQLMAQGMVVVGVDIDAAALEEMAATAGSGGRFVPRVVDLFEVEAIATLFEGLGSEFGGVDALVNNAGTCYMGEFPDISARELDRQMALNFSAAFHCCQRAVPLMLARVKLDGGVRKIVNISSNGAYNFDVFDPPHYRASKAALDTLTKDMARRYAKERIAVNSVAPAMTETPLFGVLSAEVLERAIAAMPHGRAMQPAEIAAWVGFLISSAGDVCSGNVIILNQGRDVR